MKFSISDLIAKITGLEARAEAAFKQELTDLKATVTGALTQLQADLTAAAASVTALTGEKTTLTATVTELTQKLADSAATVLGFNTFISEACLNGNLIELKGADGKPLAADATADVRRAAMLALPLADKQTAYAGALNAAFAKAGLPNTTLPAAPVQAPGAARTDGTMKRADFVKLAPAAQLKAVNEGVKITD